MILVAFSTATEAYAQYGVFNPPMAPPFRVPVGTTLTFKSQFTTPNNKSMGVRFISGNGLSVSPDSGYGYDFLLTVTLTTSTGFCYEPTYGIVAEASNSTNQFLGLFCVCNGVVYDTNITGYPKAHPDTTAYWGDDIDFRTDTINFGSVRLNDSGLHTFVVESDSFVFPTYRRFSAFDVHEPFGILDTIPLSYPCTGNGGGLYIPTRASFHPTTVGHYFDSIHIYDPLTNDSIPLILIGDCVAAGIADNLPALQFRMFPNPCDRAVNVWLSGEEFIAVEVWNVMGERVYSSRAVNSELAVDCSSLPAGVYFAEVRTKDRIVHQRLIVAH